VGEGQLDYFLSDSEASRLALLRILPSPKLPVTNVAFGSVPAHQLLAAALPQRVKTGYRLPLPSGSQRRPADVSARRWECPRSESNHPRKCLKLPWDTGPEARSTPSVDGDQKARDSGDGAQFPDSQRRRLMISH
jgi:hypothetical protein